MDNRKLYLQDWFEGIPDSLAKNTESIKLIKKEKKESTSENELIFMIEFDLKVKQVTTIESGIHHFNLHLVKEGNVGWKISGMGH